MMLYVSCKKCSQEIPSGIAIGFAGRPVLGVHDYECPSCGHTDEYHGDDYHGPKPQAQGTPGGTPN